MVSVGEVKFIWRRGLIEDRRCGCGERFSVCPLWSRVVEATLGSIDRALADVLDRASQKARTRHLPLMLLPGAHSWYGRDLDFYRQTLFDLYQAILETASADIVVDSSKFPAYAFILQQIPEIDLRIVHLVRDPRAVAFSWMRDKEDPDAPAGRRMPRLHPAVTGLYWSGWNASIERVASMGQTPRLLVRYEDLVARPAVTVEQILQWAGVPAASLPFSNQNEVAIEVAHTVSGNPIRFNRGAVEIASDDAWQQEMGIRARRAAWATSWPTRRRYGYV